VYNGWSWGTNWAHGAVSRNAARGRKEAQRANAWTPRVVARWRLEAACTGCYTHYSARCQRRTGGRRGGELCVRHSSGGRGVSTYTVRARTERERCGLWLCGATACPRSASEIPKKYRTGRIKYVRNDALRWSMRSCCLTLAACWTIIDMGSVVAARLATRDTTVSGDADPIVVAGQVSVRE
jgi:hypothetical protein